jgi:Flp pilus assembly protein TadD
MLERNPSSPTPADYLESGLFHFNNSRFGEAAACFERAAILDPGMHEAWNNRGNTLQRIGNFFDAILNYDKALSLAPNMAGTLSNKGTAWYELGKIDMAEACYRRSIDVDPNLPQGWFNIGNAHRARCEIELAAEAYRKTLELKPDYVDCQLALSFCELETGDWPRGWERYEVRWQTGQIFPRGLPIPQWEGENLNGKSLLLYSEQGHGDGLQFMRFVTYLKDCYPDAEIDLEVRLPLARIASSLRGLRKVAVYGDRVGKYDYCCALLSVPRVMKMTVDMIPGACPYLWPANDRVLGWEDELSRDLASLGRRMRIGLCWAGMNRDQQPIASSIDRRRSTALAQYEPLCDNPTVRDGVVFISLQKGGAPAEQVKAPPRGMTIADSTDKFEDFADTAALIACCDLVISVDTSVCHLAAAIGKPTWMLSRFDGCWRWMGDREDSPWYPTLRQFRQPKAGDWQSVMLKVRDELKRVVNGASPLPWAAPGRVVAHAAE